MMNKFVVPGEVICNYLDNIICGNGLYNYERSLIAKSAGYLTKEDHPNGKTFYSISSVKSSKTPYIDAVVLARVTGISSTLVRAEIICVEDHPLKHTYKSVLRKEAIRSYLRDQAEPANSFGLGDIFRAKVVNITGSKSEGGFTYLLSTAEANCGVIYAIDESSRLPLIPISETQMYCFKSKKVIMRKVAEVKKDFVDEITNKI